MALTTKRSMATTRIKKAALLPTLERKILQYRSLEMTAFLFHAEDLRRFLAESIRASEQILRYEILPSEIKKGTLLEEIWKLLIKDKILTLEETEELSSLIQYRNDIAHRIGDLVVDLSAPNHYEGSYNYTALKTLKAYKRKIHKGILSKYVSSFSMTAYFFETTELALDYELSKLAKQIDKLYAARKLKQRL